MSLLYDIAFAAHRRDWAAIDRALAAQRPSLDICLARTVAAGERLPGLDVPDPVTVHDLPLGALVVTTLDGPGKVRRWSPAK